MHLDPEREDVPLWEVIAWCVKAKYLAGVGVVALMVGAGSLQVRADDASDAILRRLDALEKENQKLRAEIKKIETKTTAKPAPAKVAPVVADAPEVAPQFITETTYVPTDGIYVEAPRESAKEWFFKHKPGTGLTFLTPGGEITFYGQLDVSLDDTTKGIADKIDGGGNHHIGNMGWMPAMSTNISYVGVRGSQNIHDGFKFIYQLETQIDISASSGIGEFEQQPEQRGQGRAHIAQ